MGVANCSVNGADEAKMKNQFVAEKLIFTNTKFTRNTVAIFIWDTVHTLTTSVY